MVWGTTNVDGSSEAMIRISFGFRCFVENIHFPRIIYLKITRSIFDIDNLVVDIKADV